MLLSEKGRKRIKFLFFIGESIPDVLVIGLSILAAIFIHQHTDMVFFSIGSFADKRVFVIPIIVLAILPTLLFYRTMIYDFEEEYAQLYIDFAKSKGLTTHNILFSHVLRNAIINIFLHAKSITWFMLSNLLMIEYAFNIDGLMHFIMEHYSPPILAMGLLFIFVPIYAIQALGQSIIEKMTGRQVEV
ncbi:ABC transporter permease subunit [Lentibacillus daqui]|uniref:ABC transporter permease subunit n=1 Tax=Lentibacillus daqui TaxID=2911514 RepID=UPI0022B15C35|nr:ABC transporter permease subunit [Lentibacillus daqui]